MFHYLYRKKKLNLSQTLSAIISREKMAQLKVCQHSKIKKQLNSHSFSLHGNFPSHGVYCCKFGDTHSTWLYWTALYSTTALQTSAELLSVRWEKPDIFPLPSLWLLAVYKLKGRDLSCQQSTQADETARMTSTMCLMKDPQTDIVHKAPSCVVRSQKDCDYTRLWILILGRCSIIVGQAWPSRFHILSWYMYQCGAVFVTVCSYW